MSLYDTDITGIAGGGRGIGRLPDGRVVFVDRALPGSRVRVRLTHEAKRHAEGLVEDTLSPSPDAAKPECPHFPACGGCDWQHAAYAAQLGYKRQQVVDALARVGGLGETAESLVSAVVPSPLTTGFRNRLTMAFGQRSGRLALGLREHANPEHILDIPHCRVAQQPVLRAAQAVAHVAGETGLPVYNADTGRGVWRHAQIRATSSRHIQVLLLLGPDAEAHKAAVLSAAQEAMAADPAVRSLAIGLRHTRDRLAQPDEVVKVLGAQRVRESLDDLTFALSPGAFFQTNTKAAAELVSVVRDMAALRGGETLLDAYCGAGLFALALAKDAERVLGIESFAPAVEDARESAMLCGLHNVEFRAQSMAQAVRSDIPWPDVALLDPPRSGAGPQELKGVLRLAPGRLILVSCDPATCARDIKALSQAYTPERAVPVDMFPHTGHVELAVLLSRREEK